MATASGGTDVAGAVEGLLIGGYGPGAGLHRMVGGAVERAAELGDASSMVRSDAHPDLVHVVDEAADDLVTLRLRPDGISVIDRVPTAGSGPCHLAFAAEHTLLLASCYRSGTVSLHRCRPDGRVTAGTALPDPPPAPFGPHPAQDGPHAHSALDVDGRVLVADLGTDRVLQYDLRHAEPRFERAIALPPGSGPRDLLARASDRVLVLGEHDARVHVLDLEHGRCRASFDTTRRPAAGDQASGMTLTGDLLTVGLRGSDRLAVLRADADGAFRPVHAASTGGAWPRHHVVVGRTVLVANQRSDAVSALPLRPDGRLGPAEGVAAVPAPAFLLPV